MVVDIGPLLLDGSMMRRGPTKTHVGHGDFYTRMKKANGIYQRLGIFIIASTHTCPLCRAKLAKSRGRWKKKG
jgi:hypothetical protein